ncbi:TPA: sodium:proton antiporter, partial [Aeromonas hydrophila]|nr:sodium:proton antiporter [Aeromonas hydrophila]
MAAASGHTPPLSRGHAAVTPAVARSASPLVPASGWCQSDHLPHYTSSRFIALIEVCMIALSLAGIALVSVLAQWLAWSLRVPAILFLLLTGLLLGPVSGLLDPDALLGDLLFPLVSLSVAIILFEGALTLHLAELKGIGKVVRNLCSVGMLASFAVIGSAGYFLLGLDWR